MRKNGSDISNVETYGKIGEYWDHKAYISALAFYGSVKYVARLNQPAAEVDFSELKRQFPRNPA